MHKIICFPVRNLSCENFFFLQDNYLVCARFFFNVSLLDFMGSVLWCIISVVSLLCEMFAECTIKGDVRIEAKNIGCLTILD